MIDVSSHLHINDDDNGYVDNDQPLVINCCGYEKYITQNFSVNRPLGRLDYQLIYIYEGYGTYFINGQDQRFGAGTLLLFKPYEPQIYHYNYKDYPFVYWVHFTGTDVENLLKKYNINSFYLGVNKQIKIFFENITTELTLKKINFQQMINAYFTELILLINRIEQEDNLSVKPCSVIESLILELNENYKRQWTASEMASYCMLSSGYFSHLFKESTGYAPLRFLTNLRLYKAKDYLVHTDMSIDSISTSIGYDNPLYFSRLFKNFTGCSPKLYRKKNTLKK